MSLPMSKRLSAVRLWEAGLRADRVHRSFPGIVEPFLSEQLLALQTMFTLYSIRFLVV